MSDDDDALDDLVPDDEEAPVRDDEESSLTGDGEPSVADDGEASVADDGETPVRDDGETPADDGGAPLDELVERARQDQDAVDDDPLDAFEEVDVADVDVEDLWERLEHDHVGEAVDDVERTSERDVQVVDKREYCMRCQYFSAPPEVQCGHERGEILEVVDTASFEVADCPILNGEEELENLRR